jgi:co-chaperonin GroES (HSP10)
MSNIPFTPTRGRLLVKALINGEQQTSSGLIIAGISDPDNVGIVMKTGLGLEELIEKKISYRDDAGRPIRVQGVDYILLFENDIDGFYE